MYRFLYQFKFPFNAVGLSKKYFDSLELFSVACTALHWTCLREQKIEKMNELELKHTHYLLKINRERVGW